MTVQKKKALILANHRKDRSPGQRFRIEQYISHLEKNGFEVNYSYLISEKDDKIFYAKGNYLQKLFLFLKYLFIRIKDTININQYCVVYLYREAFVWGSVVIEKVMKWRGAKFIFDYDDSIWIPAVSEGNKSLAFLKNANKTKKLIKISHTITPGNEYLANYARPFNNNVQIVPTTIDTNEYIKLPKTENIDKVCIGWSGSFSTIEHFKTIIPVFKIIKEKYENKVVFKVIGDKNYVNDELNIKGEAWRKESEVQDLSNINIGIMPLPDDEWSRGKCGLKGLQYMALEIPTIMSPVGVNVDIINDGINGYLAKDANEWIEKLSLLIESENLRNILGRKGRETVLEKYSVEANRNLYLKIFEEVSK